MAEQLPADLDVVHSFDVLLKNGSSPLMRKPDAVVASAQAFQGEVTRFSAGDVALVVEILPEESEDIDLRVKLREYAAAGIPNCWTVALDGPPSLVAYSIADGRYEIAATGTRMINVMIPSPMKLNLNELIR
ncbi:Uma2 family endonuclease [Lentzea sp.]|uniref:Uma2 family endonuclease n=1 Tax=Lentzea sp. TaxID=56099 RepID=UPI002CBA6518|nr:Uma2 family endonuclease [Lentzea sp.]HUQ55454.1 Uma2 family endonuclease [Lentzea sp.]